MHSVVLPTPARIVELERLGDEIAELSAHLDAATARFLTLLREFEEGYRVVRDSDGRLHFSTPRGRPIPEVPSPPAVPPDPMRALVVAHEDQGFRIGARTGLPSWCGERLDLGWAIGVLHPACGAAAPRSASG